jgi:penicillin-binding protein 1A
LLAVLRGDESRVIVDSDQIAEIVKQATVAIEDRRFYEHEGVDYTAIGRALWADIRAGQTMQGGSTITQQFIKNVYLPEETQTEKTLSRKLREAALAYQLEKQWTKDRILTNYLNAVYFGHGAYGIEMAARTYFGRPARRLSLAQAALLAGLVRHPSEDDPFTDPARARVRRQLVLDSMVELGYVTPEEAAKAAGAPLPKVPHAIPVRSHVAPYYVEYVIQQVVKEFGAARTFGGGLRVYTALDPRLQRCANNAAKSVLDRPTDPAVALVAIDPGTGEIKAIVGGRDFKRQQFNVATQGHRQPGSAFKPFALVAALEKDISPQSIFNSAPKTIDMGEGADPWRVSTYSGGYSGPITLFDATVYSDNTVYADLSMMVGPENIATAAHSLGIGSDVGTNPSIALGGLRQGVTPLEMTSAYATLANGGERVVGGEASQGEPVPIAIRKVTDAEGDLLFRNVASRQRVLQPWQAGLMTDILQQVVLRGTGTAAALGRPCAGKTGTTSDYADAWFCGYTPDLAASVWIGYVKTQRPLYVRGIKVAGGTFPAMIWRDFMTQALAGTPAHGFPAVAVPRATKAIVCARTGDLATRWCPERLTAFFFHGHVPTRACTFHGPHEVPMPDVTAMPLRRAEKALRKANLEWTIEWVAGPDSQKGLVVSQRPPAGKSIMQSEIVTLQVGGGESPVVPDVVGLSREAAERLLTASGLTFSVIFTGSAGDQGFVVAQDPAGGSSADGSVSISVGGSDVTVAVPDVVGMTLADARSTLARHGLGAAATSDDDTTIVSAQDPPAGASVQIGALVTLTAP